MTRLADHPSARSMARPADQASRLRAAVAAAEPSIEHTAAVVDAQSSATGGSVVAIASGKGGVGKTTISVNVAAALAQRGAKTGRRVALVDADIGVANADILCGVDAPRRLAPSAARDAEALRRCVVATRFGFDLYPGVVGPGMDQDADAARWLSGVLAEVAKDHDVVLVDLGAGVGRFVTGVMAAADRSIVVTTPEPTAQADAYMLLKCLERRTSAMSRCDSANHIELDGRIGVVTNLTRSSDDGDRAFARLRATAERFLGLRILSAGAIRAESAMQGSVRRRRPLVGHKKRCGGSRDLRAVARWVETACGV